MISHLFGFALQNFSQNTPLQMHLGLSEFRSLVSIPKALFMPELPELQNQLFPKRVQFSNAEYDCSNYLYQHSEITNHNIEKLEFFAPFQENPNF